MKGHIRKRGNSWAIVLEVRDPVTGERKRKWHTFTGDDGSLPTKRAAEAECRPSRDCVGRWNVDRRHEGDGRRLSGAVD
jgi:hypothetical protein